jgi:hypothetical protein
MAEKLEARRGHGNGHTDIFIAFSDPELPGPDILSPKNLAQACGGLRKLAQAWRSSQQVESFLDFLDRFGPDDIGAGFLGEQFGFVDGFVVAETFAVKLGGGEAGDGSDERNDVSRIVLEGPVEGVGPEFTYGLMDVASDHLVDDLVDGEPFVLSDEVLGELPLVSPLRKGFLFLKPVLVTSELPIGDVLLFKVGAVITQGVDDLGVGETILEHHIDSVTDGLGFAGDFARASAVGFGLGRDLCGRVNFG